jgi:hypothetical protein
VIYAMLEGRKQAEEAATEEAPRYANVPQLQAGD